MTDQENLELIENARQAFEKLLRQATGIEVVVEADIYASFQDTRPLAEAARSLDWSTIYSDTVTSYRPTRSYTGGVTQVYVPTDPSYLAKYVDLAINPLADEVALLVRLTARIALARMLVYALPEEPE